MSEAGDSDPERQAETRHKLANVFQLLSTLTRMRAQRAEDPESRRHLGWMLEMIQALGVLQHRLHSPGGEDFARYLEDMALHWRRLCAERPIEIRLSVQPVRTPENHASALALIVNELVMNAIAHGFPGERGGVVSVELESLGDRAALTVSDDGQGYDPQAVDKSRLGLWLVAGLAAQVRGALATTNDGGGVHSRLEFPIAASASR